MSIINLYLKSIFVFLESTNERYSIETLKKILRFFQEFLYSVEIPKGSTVKYRRIITTNSTFFLCGWGKCYKIQLFGLIQACERKLFFKNKCALK